MNLFNSNLERVCSEASYTTRCFTIQLICSQHSHSFDPDTQLPHNSTKLRFSCALFLWCSAFPAVCYFRRKRAIFWLKTVKATHPFLDVCCSYFEIHLQLLVRERRLYRCSYDVPQPSRCTYFHFAAVQISRRATSSAIMQIINYSFHSVVKYVV